MKKRILALLISSALAVSNVAVAKPLSVSETRLMHQRVRQPSKMYTRENIEYLSKIIMHEAGNTESDRTSYLVGVVVLKRVKSKLFPDTVKEVLLQDNPRQYMSQAEFDRVKPNERSVEIAEELLIKGFKGIKKYPNDLLYHANFTQGSVYEYSEGIYFCRR
jgi:hypothetical protein